MTSAVTAARQAVDELERQRVQLEAEAATADAERMPMIGGMLAAIGIKLRGANERVRAALDLEAAAERERQRKADELARAELLDRCRALQAQYDGWLAECAELDAAVGRLWQHYGSIQEQRLIISRELQKRDMQVGADVWRVDSLSGAALAARDGRGNLTWGGKR